MDRDTGQTLLPPTDSDLLSIMQALRAVLDALPDKDRPDSVRQLLDLLSPQDFVLDLCICSFGGVSSTELSNFLNRAGISTNLLSDGDSLKHSNGPPAFGSTRPHSVLYVYGDPLASIASHYRRGQAFHQALKTSGNSRLQQATFPPDLATYVQVGQDLFGYEEHFRRWRNEPSSYNIIMVRYDELWEIGVCSQLLRLICRHRKDAGQVEELAHAFCAGRRQRLSEVPPEWSGRMYVELQTAMSAMPPLLVRGGPDAQVLLAYGSGGELLYQSPYMQQG